MKGFQTTVLKRPLNVALVPYWCKWICYAAPHKLRLLLALWFEAACLVHYAVCACRMFMCCPHGNLGLCLHHWPVSCLCVGCCWESKGLDMGPSLFRCFGLCGCGFVIATLLPPRMMHVVLMHLAWAVYVCTVSSYFSITLFYIFLTPNTHYPMSPLSYLVTNISSILYVASQTLKQPALVWMHKIKALHFNEQLFKVRFLVAWYGCVCM